LAPPGHTTRIVTSCRCYTVGLAYACAYDAEHLIGFVNLAWDGGIHTFLLDTTVHPDLQRSHGDSPIVR